MFQSLSRDSPYSDCTRACGPTPHCWPLVAMISVLAPQNIHIISLKMLTLSHSPQPCERLQSQQLTAAGLLSVPSFLSTISGTTFH
jgi:hypothetical protein